MAFLIALSYASGPFSVELSHTTAEGGLMGQKAILDETAKYGIPSLITPMMHLLLVTHYQIDDLNCWYVF